MVLSVEMDTSEILLATAVLEDPLPPRLWFLLLPEPAGVGFSLMLTLGLGLDFLSTAAAATGRFCSLGDFFDLVLSRGVDFVELALALELEE